MAISQKHDYQQVYNQTYDMIKKAVGDGATNGGREGLVKALSNLEIDGQKINIDSKNIQKALNDAMQEAFQKFKAKGFNVAKINFEDLFSLDAKSIQTEINKALKEIEINPTNKAANKRLYGLGTTALFKGIAVKGAKGETIDREYLDSLRQFAGVSEAQANRIKDTFNNIIKSIDLDPLIKQLVAETQQMQKTAQEADKAAQKIEKAQNKIDKAHQKTKQVKPETKSQNKKEDANIPLTPQVDTSKTTSNIKATDQAVRDTVDDVRELQMALKDVLGFGYAIDTKSNPLSSLITNVQDGVVSLEETMSKIKELGKFKELINGSDIATQTASGEGLDKFNSFLLEITESSLTAEDAFNKLRDTIKGGSGFIGTEGQTTAKRKDDIVDLSKELQRLKDVLAQVENSENNFEQKIAQDAKQSIKTIEDYIQKKSMVFDTHAQKWVPVKPKEEKVQEEVSKKKLDFDNSEMKNALAAMFGKATETKQEVDKVTSGLDEMGQVGATAGEKVAEGIKAAKEEAAAHKENTENIQKEAEAKKESRVEDEKKSATDDQMARYQQELAALQKTRDEKKAIYDEEAAHLRELQIKSDAIFAQSQDTRKYDHYKESYKNAKLDNFDFIKDQPVSHIDALWQRFVDHGKRYLNTGDDAALGKAAGYYKQYADAVREAGEEVQRAKIGKNDLTDKLVSEAEALEKTKGITFDAKELNAVNIEINQVRENVEKLNAEYDKAQKKLDKAESEMMAVQLSPAVQQQLQLREETDKTTAAVKKQKEAMQAPTESMDGAVESEQKLADAEEKVAEKAKEAADAEGKLADKKKETAEAVKAKADAEKESEFVGDNSEAIAEEEKEKEAVDETKESIDKKTAARKEEQSIGSNGEAAEQNRKEAEAAHAAAVEYEKKEEAKRAEAAIEPEVPKTPVSVQVEDLSPLETQLGRINELLMQKNNLFERETAIVIGAGNTESNALKEVAGVLKDIVDCLKTITDKKFSVSLKGVEKLNELVGKDLTGVTQALKELSGIGEININVSAKGIKGLENLTKLDLSKLQDRLDAAWIHIDDFAKNLSQIKVEDDSLFNSLNNLLKDGEKLKNLATVLKASKKQIDNVTEVISKPKEQSKTKVDLSTWKELKSAVQEYYELRAKGHDGRTEAEKQRLHEIYQIWNQVKGKVEETTAALKEQGQSTKLVENVAKAYTTGFAEWQNQRVADSLISDRTDLSKLSERFNKRLSDYPSKYVEKAAQKVQKLTTMVDALNAKPIDAAKPEDIAQIEKEIEAAKTLANEIQQGFNSADWRVANQTKVSNLQNEISMYMKNFSALSEETKRKLHALIEELDHIGSNEGLAQAVQKFNKIKIAARDAGEEGTSFFSKMGKQIEHLNAQAFAMYFSWQDIIRYIRQAAGAVIELDSALTELRKVSDASTERLQQSFETSAKTAKELGSTVDAVINQTADWSRVGFKIDEAEQLARITTLFQTVGDNMTTESASEAMISTLKGFEMGVNQAEDIVDKYNIILAVLLFQKSIYG